MLGTRRSAVAAALLVIVAMFAAAACEIVEFPPSRSEINPTGVLDSVTGGDGEVRVTGWASEFANFAAVSDPTRIMVMVDGNWVPEAFVADRARPDVTSALISIDQLGYVRPGDRYGFDITVPAGSGDMAVCVVALNQWRDELNTAFEHVLLGCEAVTVT